MFGLDHCAVPATLVELASVQGYLWNNARHAGRACNPDDADRSRPDDTLQSRRACTVDAGRRGNDHSSRRYSLSGTVVERSVDSERLARLAPQ